MTASGEHNSEWPNGVPAALEARLDELERRLGYRFCDRRALACALTHSSSTALPFADNERLEFLGDSVLSLAISEYLFRSFSGSDEGEMTRIRSHVVSRMILAKRAEALGLGEMALFGKGVTSNGELPSSVQANLFESVVAAIYLDGGFLEAREFILEQLAGEIEGVATKDLDQNFKSILQQYGQSRFGHPPLYQILGERGPNHGRIFEIAVVIHGRRFPPGRGRNKKDAEQAAARAALVALGELPPG